MPEYDFRSLSSYDLELLVRDLLQAETGLRFENFKAGRDGGIDLRHSASSDQTTIVQVKHYVESGYSVLLRDLRDKEAPKVERLRPEHYIVATSVPLLTTQVDALKSLFTPHCSGEVNVFGQEGLNNLLGRHSNIERQHYKLWLTSSVVLERLVHGAIWNRTESTLDEIADKMRLYVQHDGFLSAYQLLEEKQVCIISGQPGIGKTTLAEMLLAKYIGDDFEVRVLGDITEAFDADSADREAKIVFFYDDFLGQTRLRDSRSGSEDNELLRFIHSVKKKPNRRLILTTREYILREARQSSEKLSSEEIELSKLVLDLAHYTRSARAHMLFNHLYFSGLPQRYCARLIEDGAVIRVIDHPHFNPRIIEWMTSLTRQREYAPEQYTNAFLNALNNQDQVWTHAFENHTTEDSKNLMYVLYSMGESATLTDLERCFHSFIFEDRSSTEPIENSRFISSLRHLDGSFITTNRDWKGAYVSFYNPSIREFVGRRLCENMPLLRQLLHSAKLFSQCETIWPILKRLPMNGDVSSQIKQELCNCIRTTLGVHNAALSGNSDVKMATQALKMATNLPQEQELTIISHTVKWITGLPALCGADYGKWDTLVDYIEGRLRLRFVNPIINHLGDTILRNPRTLDDFEGAISFLNDYIDESSKEEYIVSLSDDFSSFCSFKSADDFDSEDPEEYRDKADTIESVGQSLDVDVGLLPAQLREAAVKIEQEQQQEDEYQEQNIRSPLRPNTQEEITSQEIVSLFNTLQRPDNTA